MLIKRIVLTSILILWMIIIFMFSNANSVKSQNTSDKVANTVIDTVSEVTKKEISSKTRKDLIKDTRFYVRKTAHFTLYFVLGILTYITLTSYGVSKNIIILSISFCLLYSISDEIHQIYSDGRTFKVLDIFIDTLGSTISISTMNFIRKNN